MKPTKAERQQVVERLIESEWLPESEFSLAIAETMIEKGWLVKEARPINGTREDGKVRPHYGLTHKGITELVKPTYRLTWDANHWESRRAWHSQQGHYGITQLGTGRFHAECNNTEFDALFDTLKEAKDACRKHDWSLITRRPLRKTAKNTWATAGERITVKRMTAPELRMEMPMGQTTTTPGYAIYVDGVYRTCAFTLRDAQHKVSYNGRNKFTRIDVPEGRKAA